MTTRAVTDEMQSLKDEAIDWLIRLSEENCSTADRQAFEKWINQSIAHQTTYEEISRRMDWLERVAKMDIHTRKNALHYAKNKRRRIKKYRVRFAVTVCVFLTFGLATFSSEGWYGMNHYYQVARGNHETITLADGSNMEINTDSEVNVRINHWQRSVDVLRGEVYFRVAHDPNKPFIVNAGAGRTIDIGTEFDVYRQPEKVIIAVQEGRVRVEAKKNIDLVASQATAYNQSGDFVGLPSKLNVDSVTAWRQGKVVFNNQRLDEVLAEIGRYHNTKLSLAELNLANNKVSGTFFIDRLENNLSTIANSLNLTLHRLDNGEIVLSKR
jgi:transmembrane sensor